MTNWDGIEWRQFEITHSSLNCVLLLKNILVSINIHWHQEERWWDESWLNHLLILNWLFQWDGHKTGIVIAIDGDVCQTVSVNDKYVLPDSISHFTFGMNDLNELVSKLINKHGYSINTEDEGNVMMDLIIIQRWRRNMKYQMNKPSSLRMNEMIVQSVFSEIDCLELMGLIN